jgi:hypothetical protein
MSSRSSGVMRANCSRHMVDAAMILQPTVVISQGAGLDKPLRAALGVTRAHGPNLSECELGGNRFIVGVASPPDTGLECARLPIPTQHRRSDDPGGTHTGPHDRLAAHTSRGAHSRRSSSRMRNAWNLREAPPLVGSHARLRQVTRLTWAFMKCLTAVAKTVCLTNRCIS